MGHVGQAGAEGPLAGGIVAVGGRGSRGVGVGVAGPLKGGGWQLVHLEPPCTHQQVMKCKVV